MHSCPDCGQACDCDGEDVWMEDERGMPLEECGHECDAYDETADDGERVHDHWCDLRHDGLECNCSHDD